jgi:hypothetical protein
MTHKVGDSPIKKPGNRFSLPGILFCFYLLSIINHPEILVKSEGYYPLTIILNRSLDGAGLRRSVTTPNKSRIKELPCNTNIDNKREMK